MRSIAGHRASRVLWLILCLVTVPTPAVAHPGNGIVVAKDGTVYFADVANEIIWKLATDGTLTPLVSDRWTHSLFLTGDGTLYYEREEPVDGVAPCSFWMITAAGEHTQLIAPESNRRQFAGGDFVVDDDRNVYFAHNERDAESKWRTYIMRRTPRGEVSVFTGRGTGPLFTDGPADRATIRIVTAMARGPQGHIYFADRDHIRRIDGEGTITTIATGLIDEKPTDPPHRRGPPTTINRLYGLAVGSDGTVYIAYQAGRRVIRIAPDGRRSTVYTSLRPWSPLGVTVHEGAVYVLESGHERNSPNPGPRVRRVNPDGTVVTLTMVKEPSNP